MAAANNSTTKLTNCTVSGNASNGDGGGCDTGYMRHEHALQLHRQRQHRPHRRRRGQLQRHNDADRLQRQRKHRRGRRRPDHQYSSTTTLTNCTVSDNSATYGGGVAELFGTATLTDCTVSGNSASDGGGGCGSRYKSTATLTNCTVSGNTAAGDGGGVYSEYSGTATLTDCTVNGNTASGDGGGLFIPRTTAQPR